MKRKRFLYVVSLSAASCWLNFNSLAFADEVKGKTSPKEQILAPDMQVSPKGKESTKDQDTAKVPETPIEAITVNPDQLVNKAQDYLNKNVKFTVPFFAFSNLALDYKPAFRSSRTYLSFLVLRPNTHTPFSEIKLAMLVPKEKDPQTKMLQTLREGDTIEIIGRVFACPMDEPWLDVLRLKKIASAAKKGESGEEKTSDSSEDQSP